MEQSYWNENGKYQEFLNKASDKMPSFGYTSNIYMNLLITMSHLYYDAYNNGGCNIEDCYMKDYKRHVAPLLPEVSINDFLFGNEEKMERTMDNVLNYLADKPMDYPVYTVWFSYEDKQISRVQPKSESGHEMHPVTFGMKEEMERWCMEQMTFSGVKDVTEDMAAKTHIQPAKEAENAPTLPDACYSVLGTTGELILLCNGKSGYFPSEYSGPDKEKNRALADHLNDLMGVTKAQVLAMECGSMFGWDKPGADPRMYIKKALTEKIAGAEEKAPCKGVAAPAKELQSQQR